MDNKEVNKKVRKVFISGLVVLVVCLTYVPLFAEINDPAVLIKKGATYVGSDKCSTCHLKLARGWEASKHARNFATLQGEELKNPECLKCHTTAFEKGGYSLKKTPEQNKKFENVTCEACHGPGSLHLTSKDKEDIIHATKECPLCHNPHRQFAEEIKARRATEKMK